MAQAVTGEVHTVPWDYLVLCPGPVTRTFGTPGGEQFGRGMKTLAQATHLHDHVLAELEPGNAVGDEQRRAAHCTFVVAGAGYAGVETAAALHLFARWQLPRLTNLRPEHLRWVLADVAPHVPPELGGTLSGAALGRLRQRGIDMRLGTGISGITESAVRLTDGRRGRRPGPDPGPGCGHPADRAARPAAGRHGRPPPARAAAAALPAMHRAVPVRHLSGDDARQTAARILAHDQEGWLT